MTTADTTAVATGIAPAASATGASGGTTTPPAPTTTQQTTNAPAAAPAVPPAAPPEIALTLPKDAAITATDLDQVKAFAKEHGLTQKAAEAALTQTNAVATAARAAHQAAADKGFADLVAAWPAELKADKELGGADHDAKMTLADKALASFGSEKLIKGLKDSGLINDPELRRLLYRVGKASSEDNLHSRGAGAAAVKSEDALLRERYPKMYA